MRVLGVFENWAVKRPTATTVSNVATDRQTDKHRGLLEMTPLCTRICPYPFFEATPLGAAPRPPVMNINARSAGQTPG